MAMELSLVNMFQFISVISPFLLGFLLIMASIFNQNIKGIIYLGGIFIAFFINIFIVNLIKSPASPLKAASCDLFEMPFQSNFYNSPSFNSLFIAFTFSYIFIPMYFNDELNFWVIAFLLSLFFIDAFSRIRNHCNPISGIAFGGLLGLVLGFFWVSLLQVSGYKSLLYYDEFVSNKSVCERPSKQKFKCSVYKNGQLIKNL